MSGSRRLRSCHRSRFLAVLVPSPARLRGGEGEGEGGFSSGPDPLESRRPIPFCCVHQIQCLSTAWPPHPHPLPPVFVSEDRAGARGPEADHRLMTAHEVVGVFRIVVVVDHAVEERGGRQLLLVSGNHQLASAINRPDGIPREHLRSLVKEDDIEWKLGRFQVHADRERTHHQTRLESDESIRQASEKLSQRQVSLLLADFARGGPT